MLLRLSLTKKPAAPRRDPVAALAPYAGTRIERGLPRPTGLPRPRSPQE